MTERIKKDICNIIEDWDNEDLQKLLEYIKGSGKITETQAVTETEKTVGKITVKNKGGDLKVKIRGFEVFFPAETVGKLASICRSSGNAKTAGKDLYTWFVGNRIDVINNTQLTGQNDPMLTDLYNYFQENIL